MDFRVRTGFEETAASCALCKLIVKNYGWRDFWGKNGALYLRAHCTAGMGIHTLNITDETEFVPVSVKLPVLAQEG
jgi:hypothetical protein